MIFTTKINKNNKKILIAVIVQASKQASKQARDFPID